jgi:hypothetical protein
VQSGIYNQAWRKRGISAQKQHLDLRLAQKWHFGAKMAFRLEVGAKMRHFSAKEAFGLEVGAKRHFSAKEAFGLEVGPKAVLLGGNESQTSIFCIQWEEQHIE